MAPSPGTLLYSCPCTYRCVGRCGTAAAAASPGAPGDPVRSSKAGISPRALWSMPKKSKLSEPHWGSTKPQARVPSPGLLPPPLDLLPQIAAAAAAPTPSSSSCHVTSPNLEALIHQLERTNVSLEGPVLTPFSKCAADMFFKKEIHPIPLILRNAPHPSLSSPSLMTRPGIEISISHLFHSTS